MHRCTFGMFIVIHWIYHWFLIYQTLNARLGKSRAFGYLLGYILSSLINIPKDEGRKEVLKVSVLVLIGRRLFWARSWYGFAVAIRVLVGHLVKQLDTIQVKGTVLIC